MRLKSRSVWAAVIWSLDWGLRICFISHMICSVIWPAGWLLLLVGGLRSYLCGPFHETTCLSILAACHLAAVCQQSREKESWEEAVRFMTYPWKSENMASAIVCLLEESLSPSPHSQRILTFFKITKLCMTNSWISSYLRWLYAFYCLLKC